MMKIINFLFFWKNPTTYPFTSVGFYRHELSLDHVSDFHNAFSFWEGHATPETMVIAFFSAKILQPDKQYFYSIALFSLSHQFVL